MMQMTTKNTPITAPQLASFTSRKATGLADTLADAIPDSLTAWMTRYLTFAVVGVRSPAVAEKIALHLDRFIQFFTESYGPDRIMTLLFECSLPREHSKSRASPRRPPTIISPRFPVSRRGCMHNPHASSRSVTQQRESGNSGCRHSNPVRSRRDRCGV